MYNTPLLKYREKLNVISNLSDFIDIMQELSNLISSYSGLKPIQWKEKQIGFLIANKNDLYKEFYIPKKRKGKRKILAPSSNLKLVQKEIQQILNLFYDFPEKWEINEDIELIARNLFKSPNSVHGFLNNRSIVSNARNHVGKAYVFNFDLQNFFPSIGSGKIVETLKNEPFAFSHFTSQVFANICTLNNELPQGAPTSPLLSNIVSRRMDNRFESLCTKIKSLKYSRYADDITFSCDLNIFDDDFLNVVKLIIEDESYAIHPKKTRLQLRSQRQEVTGVIVNQKINVTRKRIKLIRALLHNWRKIGYNESQSEFVNKFKRSIDLSLYLKGQLNYVKMVRGADDWIYIKYLEEFNSLIHENNR